MNWLEHHLRSFVFPLLKMYAAQKKRCNTSGKEWSNEVPFASNVPLFAHFDTNKNSFVCPDLKSLQPFTGKLRGSEENPRIPVEAKLFSTMLKSLDLKKDVSWETNHLLSKPAYGSSPAWKLVSDRTLAKINMQYSSEDHAHWYLKTCVKAIRNRLKGTDRQVILLGRDVWLIAVLCQKAGIPYVYDPRISRTVARADEMKGLLPGYLMREGDLLFDTGFAGTIHRLVEEHSGMKLENLMMSANDKGKQVFPNSGIARNYALYFEYLPKYFKSGTVKDGEVVQYMADFSEFAEAVMGTIWAWHHESPAVIISERQVQRMETGISSPPSLLWMSSWNVSPVQSEY